jgi:hypothetical protein
VNQEAIEKRAERALLLLAETDESCAELKYEALVAEARYKASVDAQFLALTGNVEERKAAARRESEPLYLDFLKAQREFDIVKYKRDHEMVVIEWLRSANANRRQGT